MPTPLSFMMSCLFERHGERMHTIAFRQSCLLWFIIPPLLLSEMMMRREMPRIPEEKESFLPLRFASSLITSEGCFVNLCFSSSLHVCPVWSLTFWYPV